MTRKTYAQPATWAANRDTYARKARDRFDRQETRLQAAVHKAIGDWVEQVQPQALASLTADASPQPESAAQEAQGLISRTLSAFTLADAENVERQMLRQRDKFAALLDAGVMPIYSRMLDEVLGRAVHDKRIGADLFAWKRQWLADRQQVLVGVPDKVASITRTALSTLAGNNGTSVAQATELVQSVLDRGHPQWANRAETIARTEVVGSNNQGSLATWSALSEASGIEATKTWLATSDARTRPSHAALDGTTVGIGDEFDNGLNGPGDESGAAEETINCRCTLTYDFPEGEPDDMPEDLTAAADLPDSVVEAIDTGVAIMLTVAPDDVARLAPDGDTSAWPGLHCTVGFHRDKADDISPDAKASLLDALAPLADLLPIGAEAFATADFNPDSDERDPCAVLLVQSGELAEVHDGVTRALSGQESTTFPIWVPHVALGYNVAVADVAPPGAAGSELVFDRLVVGFGPEQIVITNPMPGIDNAEPSDPGVENAPEALTAATEDDVTAPPAPLTDEAPPVVADPAAPAATDLTPQGQTWSGPIAKLDIPSSDGRVIASTGGTIRTLPLPLSWQRESGDAHDDSVIVGRVLVAEVRGDVLWASGDYNIGPDCFESMGARDLVANGLGMVSVDLGVKAVGFADEQGNPIDPGLVDEGTAVVEVAVEWEFAGVTLVGFPAFDGVRIVNDPMPEEATTGVPDMPAPLVDGTFAGANPAPAVIADDAQSLTLTDGTTVNVGDPVGYTDADGQQVGTLASLDIAATTAAVQPADAEDGTTPAPVSVPVADLVPAADEPAPLDDEDPAMALLAASEVRPYAAAYFAKRELPGPTPLTVNPETGEVYGHLATFNEPHAGKLMEGKRVFAPHSLRDYADFHLSPVLTDDGAMLDVGRITVGTGHAKPGGGHFAAVQHYDDTGTQVAVVRAYEDSYGIQLTGQLIHDVPAAKVEELMRSPLSGDWRTRNGNLELCAALAVNAPGFPVRRTPLVGQTSGGQQLSLVAAGMLDETPRSAKRTVTLPSGASIDGSDFDALVAAAAASLRGHQPADQDGEATKLAMRRARARLALA